MAVTEPTLERWKEQGRIVDYRFLGGGDEHERFDWEVKVKGLSKKEIPNFGVELAKALGTPSNFILIVIID